MPNLADWCVVDLVREGTSDLRRWLSRNADPERETVAPRAAGNDPPISTGRVLQRVVTTEPLLLPEVGDADLANAARDPQHLELLRTMRRARWCGAAARHADVVAS